MKLLADANVGRLIVEMLEKLGHDVLQASSFPPGTPDDQILRRAAQEGRVVITSDKDFGDLIFRAREAAIGVILLRIDVAREAERCAVLERFWSRIEPAVADHFVGHEQSRAAITTAVVRTQRRVVAALLARRRGTWRAGVQHANLDPRAARRYRAISGDGDDSGGRFDRLEGRDLILT